MPPVISTARVRGVKNKKESKPPKLSNETYIAESIYYNSFQGTLYSVLCTEASFIDCLCNAGSVSPPMWVHPKSNQSKNGVNILYENWTVRQKSKWIRVAPLDRLQFEMPAALEAGASVFFNSIHGRSWPKGFFFFLNFIFWWQLSAGVMWLHCSKILRAVMIAWKKQYNFRPTNWIPLMPRDLLPLNPNTEISHQHFY